MLRSWLRAKNTLKQPGLGRPARFPRITLYLMTPVPSRTAPTARERGRALGYFALLMPLVFVGKSARVRGRQTYWCCVPVIKPGPRGGDPVIGDSHRFADALIPLGRVHTAWFPSCLALACLRPTSFRRRPTP